MALEAQRQLLDQLMGQERNLKEEERTHRRRHFSDPEVDKMYLCGCSAYELFKNTKSDLGDNPKIPDDACKADWENLSQEEKDKYGYEYDTMKFLERLVQSADRKIWKNKQRCFEDDAEEMREHAYKILDLEDAMVNMLQQVERLAAEGEVDRSLSQFNQVKVNIDVRNSMLRIPEHQKKLIVCPVSGNLISSADNDDRLRCHFEGKQYRGWKQVRAMLEAYKKNPPPPPGQKRKSVRSISKDRERDNSRGRDRNRQPSRERPRVNSVTRGRSRENERGTFRGRDQGRNFRSRSPERNGGNRARPYSGRRSDRDFDRNRRFTYRSRSRSQSPRRRGRSVSRSSRDRHSKWERRDRSKEKDTKKKKKSHSRKHDRRSRSMSSNSSRSRSRSRSERGKKRRYR